MKKSLLVTVLVTALLFTMCFSVSASEALPPFTMETLSGVSVNGESLDIAVRFKAVETSTEVESSPWKDYNADFVLSCDKPITPTSGKLVGQYASYSSDWVTLQPDTTYPAGTEIRLVQAATSRYVTYEEVVGIVKEFNCGVIANDDLNGATFTLSLKLYERANGVETGNSVTVVSRNFTVGLPEYKSTVAKFGSDDAIATLSDNSRVYLDLAMVFEAVEEEASEPFASYNADFTLTCDKDIELSKGFYLAGYYDKWSESKYDKKGVWEGFPINNGIGTLTAGTEVRVLKASGFDQGAGIKYSEIVDLVKQFKCGIYASPELDEALKGAKFTLSLKLYERENGEETGKSLTVTTNEFIYDKWKEASDAGYYADGTGKMRFLFNADVDLSTVEKVGVVFFKDGQLTNITVDNADITADALNSKAFHIDIKGLTEENAGQTYYAKAYIQSKDEFLGLSYSGVTWSDVISCTPDFAKKIND